MLPAAIPREAFRHGQENTHAIFVRQILQGSRNPYRIGPGWQPAAALYTQLEYEELSHDR